VGIAQTSDSAGEAFVHIERDETNATAPLRGPFRTKVALLSGILLAVLLVALCGLAFGSEGSSGDQQSAADDSGATEAEPVEQPGKRTATSETFELPDGSREARIYQAPVNYRDDEGKWQPIEEGLEREGGAFVNGDNSFDLRLPSRMGTAPLRVSIGENWISERLMAAASDPGELAGEAATYEAANPGTTFEFSTLGTGLEQKITLASAAEPSSLHFELDTSAGLLPSKADDGSIEFRGSDGDVVAVLQPPVMYDSNPTRPAMSDAVSYQLASRNDGTWELNLEADREWLTEPDRAWPVTIDPAITEKFGAGMDCTIFGGAYEKSSGFCGTAGWQWDEAFALHSTNEVGRNLIKFPLNNHHTNPYNKGYVTAASINLYAPNAVQGTNAIQLRNVVMDPEHLWGATTTWQCKFYSGGKCLTGNKWTSPGGDYGPSIVAEIATAQRGSQAGWWTFEGSSLVDLVQKWIGGGDETPNTGLLLKQDNDSLECTGSGPACTDRMALFASSAYSEAEKRPYISMTYWPPAPTTSKVTSPTDGTTTARRLKLKAGWVSGVTQVTFQWREGKSGKFQTIPASLVRDQNNQSVSWPINVTGKTSSDALYFDVAHVSEALTKRGGTVQVRALFEGGAGGYSAPVEAIVNRWTGGPNDATAEVGPGAVDLLTGNFVVSRSDVSIPGFVSTMAFARTHSSRGIMPGPGQPSFNETAKALAEQNMGVLGLGWKPAAAVEGKGEWRGLTFKVRTETGEEGESYSFTYAMVSNTEGKEFAFEQEVTETGTVYLTPSELSGWTLAAVGATFVLTDPAGNKTTFSPVAGSSEFVPSSVEQVGASTNATRMIYTFPEPGKQRLKEVIAPSGPGVAACTEGSGNEHLGCKVLKFAYEPATKWGAPASYGERLKTVSYFEPGNTEGPWTIPVAEYKYNAEGRLVEEWNPQLPKLVEKYSYSTDGQLKTITPPGQEPWTMEYGFADGEEGSGRLVACKRASLLASPAEAQTTVVYGVPVSGSGAPYDLGSSAISKWDQQDYPIDASAVFPPDQVPGSNPPSSYSRAIVYYMDPEGHDVNTARTGGGGPSAPSITTAEVNQFGNVTRELTAQNRLRAVAAGAGSVAKSHDLDTHRIYSPDGAQLEEEFGPKHSVRIAETGSTIEARFYRFLKYADPAPPAGMPAYHLPTEEVSAALDEKGSLLDQRVTETRYNWNLRKATESIVDPGSGHLAITSKTVYDESTGLPIERRQPSNPGGEGAGTTKTSYYTASQTHQPCEKTPLYAGLPCEIRPAAQASGTGRPELVVRKYNSYSQFSQPVETTEAPGLAALVAGTPIRKTVRSYDSAGRPLSRKIVGGGTTVPKVLMIYNENTGLPASQKFECEGSCAGFDDQTTTTSYDALGRLAEYADADGNVAKMTYDVDGRPVSVSDGKGSRTLTYDAASGLLVKLEDSAGGLFTGAYDADGDLIERTLPDGLTATTTYNETGEPVHLKYTKASSCGASCTWYDEGAERSIFGQVLSQTDSLDSRLFTYDRAGRLTSAAETPSGGACTTRSYSYDADSNRLSMITRAPGGACSWSGGTTQSYKYDAGDRLEGPTYDEWGRTTSLPAEFAGGKALTTSYFSTDMVATQTQNGVTNSFELDSALRHRQRVQTGGIEGAEVFHYDDPSDSPAWTARGSAWTRHLTGIGGELVGLQDSSSGTSLRLTNLHGDVVASASLSPTATALTATFRFDEFGNPVSGSSGRFGWLGGRSRRTELAAGVIQMGARSYVPSIGRFLSVDSVPGGAANAYDYANQDPMNQFDLDGCNTTSGEKFTSNKPGFIRCLKACIKAHCNARNASLKYAKFQHCFATSRGIIGIAACLSNFCDLGGLAACGLNCFKKFTPPPPPAPAPEPEPEPDFLDRVNREPWIMFELG
jgi:RHS repeat-associated protein